jgi:hypothetical protein
LQDIPAPGEDYLDCDAIQAQILDRIDLPAGISISKTEICSGQKEME